jgi:hypothetical protein
MAISREAILLICLSPLPIVRVTAFRDPRVLERKKYGRARATRSFQSSKR